VLRSSTENLFDRPRLPGIACVSAFWCGATVFFVCFCCCVHGVVVCSGVMLAVLATRSVATTCFMFGCCVCCARHIDLSINQLTGSIPSTLGELTALKYGSPLCLGVDSVRVMPWQPCVSALVLCCRCCAYRLCRITRCHAGVGL
jgi:hypothetical protein